MRRIGPRHGAARSACSPPWRCWASGSRSSSVWTAERRRRRRSGPRSRVAEALGAASAEGFERALAPRPLAFPADHGPHPAFRTEWWYWTGNLRRLGSRGRPALRIPADVLPHGARPGGRAAAVGLGHARRVHGPPRADRRRRRAGSTRATAGRAGALDLAGAAGDPFRVWLGDWVAEARARAGGWPLRLRAGEGDLRHRPHALGGEAAGAPRRARALAEERRARERVLLLLAHADAGRGRGAGRRARASGRGPRVDGPGVEHERARPRPGGLGLVRAPARRRPRADALPPPPARRRRRPGEPGHPRRAPTAARAPSTGTAVEVLVLDHWTSPRDGTRYPARWRLRVPARGLDVVVTPLLADQELDLAVRYWEGAVRVEGTADGRPLGGSGYVELVGYAAAAGGAAEAVRQ